MRGVWKYVSNIFTIHTSDSKVDETLANVMVVLIALEEFAMRVSYLPKQRFVRRMLGIPQMTDVERATVSQLFLSVRKAYLLSIEAYFSFANQLHNITYSSSLS